MTTMTGTGPDHDEIVRFVHLPGDGLGKGDPANFTEAFHPDARIMNRTATHSSRSGGTWSA